MEENKNQVKPKKKLNILFLIIVLLIIVVLSANVYATSNGFNNIFFMIKNMFESDVEQKGEELFSDREIVISYKSIEIMDGIKVQIKKLTLENEKAILHISVNDEIYYEPNLRVDEDTEKVKIITPFTYKVLNENGEVICEQKSINEHIGTYTELLELKDVNIDTKKLILQIFTNEEEKLSEIKIDLESKELEIIGMTEEIKKVSEIEVKEFLSNVVRFNFFKDLDSITKYHTEEEYRNEVKVLYALELLNKTEASEKDVYEVLEELFAEKIIEPYNVANIVVTKGEGVFKYVSPNTTHNVHSMCLEVTNISYLNGVYTAECVYVYPGKAEDGNIEELPRYAATVKFIVNDEYKYTKYSVVNSNEMQPNNEIEKEKSENVNEQEVTQINISIKNYNVPTQYIEGVKYTMSNSPMADEITSELSDTGFFLNSGKNTTQEYVMNLNFQEKEYKIIFKVEYDENNNAKKLWVLEDNEKIVGWLEPKYSGSVIDLEILMSVSGVDGWEKTIVPGLQISHPVGWEFVTVNEEVEGLGTVIREYSTDSDEVCLTMKIYDGIAKEGKLEDWVNEYCKLNSKVVKSEYTLNTIDKGGFTWCVLCEEVENKVKEYYFGRSGGFSDNENRAIFQVVEVEYENYEETDRIQLRIDLLSNMISKSK